MLGSNAMLSESLKPPPLAELANSIQRPRELVRLRIVDCAREIPVVG